MGYKVDTFAAENTGLDVAVFASRSEAERAVKTCKSVYAAGKFNVIETTDQANITFDEWNEKGW